MAAKIEKQHQMFSLIESWQQSGADQQSFCKSQGVAYSSFHYWYKKYRQIHGGIAAPSGFVPLEIPARVTDSPVIELILPDGRRLNFYQTVDASFLLTLLG